MGSNLSSDSSSLPELTAKVIQFNGGLREFKFPVTVKDVLESETKVSSPCILCNSDTLLLDEYITAMNSEEVLEMGQIYFVLPLSRLKFRLTLSDMVHLAITASSSIPDKKRGISLPSPNVTVTHSSFCNPELDPIPTSFCNFQSRFEKDISVVYDSVKKPRSSSSRRVRKGCQPNTIRLNTIHENNIC